MRRYFAVYSYDYEKVFQKVNVMTTSDFAFSYPKFESQTPSLSYLVSENQELSNWLATLGFTKEMSKNDGLIDAHKQIQDYEVIGNVNMVREGGI